MNLPSPTDPKSWPPFARLIAWGALASAALLLIGAGLSQLAAVASAQGGLLSALVAGWLLATRALRSPPWALATAAICERPAPIKRSAALARAPQAMSRAKGGQVFGSVGDGRFIS